MGKWPISTGRILFLGLQKGPGRSIFSRASFATNAVPDKNEDERMRGRGRKNTNYVGSRDPFFAGFWPIFVFWVLLLKIQSAATLSILGVRGSS